MRIVVLHSDVPRDAPPDEQDTLVQAAAVETELRAQGHDVSLATFVLDPADLKSLLKRTKADVVFNLVESVWGRGAYGCLGAQMLGEIGIPFTGAPAATIAATTDKVLSKRILMAAGLPTAKWVEGPDWSEVGEGERWIVKSVDEDASLGLDDGAVVCSAEAAAARARESASRFGGRWFAEAFLEGREFNVAMFERNGKIVVLPIGEMLFEDWDGEKPRIVGYSAKWHEETHEYNGTPRSFDWRDKEPQLYRTLEGLARECWSLFGCRGYTRVDFRLDCKNRPYILEVNANPCLSPEAGFAAAAEEGGVKYGDLVRHILRAAA
jgi:D-alanine-D-alanine ligase